jgi:hypothetical protein
MKQKLSQRFAAPLPISADTRPLLGNREMASILTLSDCSRVTAYSDVTRLGKSCRQSRSWFASDCCKRAGLDSELKANAIIRLNPERYDIRLS